MAKKVQTHSLCFFCIFELTQKVVLFYFHCSYTNRCASLKIKLSTAYMIYKIAIIVYVILYTGIALGIRSFILYRNTGINPFKKMGKVNRWI
ncbi:MAG: hypothetical protein ACI83B_000059 [Sediminicola sp.]|jgi:hypothetical protein